MNYLQTAFTKDDQFWFSENQARLRSGGAGMIGETPDPWPMSSALMLSRGAVPKSFFPKPALQCVRATSHGAHLFTCS
jgi:hypothetical protein